MANGLFGVVGDVTTSGKVDDAGVVKNLVVEGCIKTSGGIGTGGICGYNAGTIQNCTNKVNIEFTGTIDAVIGGICANNYGIITDCSNEGNITSGVGNIGGICSLNEKTIERCCNKGNITINGTNTTAVVGGICATFSLGDTNPIINNCYNSGTLKSSGFVSGIGNVVRTNSSTTVSITNCHNYGSLEGNSSAGICIFNIPSVSPSIVNLSNCYYKDDASTGFLIVKTTGEEIFEDEKGTIEAKSTDAFANGEVLYLLQQNNPGVWKQGEEGYPVFIGDEEEETILYKVTFDYNYEGSPEAIVNYLEAGETVTFPTMEREGYTFTNWSTDATGETPVEDITSITLTSDMTYYAQWQSSETEKPGDEDEDQDNDKPGPIVKPIKYYNIYIDTICPGLNVEVSKDVVQEGHQVSAYLTIQAECDTTGMRFEYKRGLFGYWKDLKELEGVQPGEYIIKNIYTDIYIRALDATLPEEEPTGIDDLEGVKAYAKDGSIYVYTPNREEVTIISMSGAIIKHEEHVGLQSYSVSRGIYIVRIGEKVFKLKN